MPRQGVARLYGDFIILLPSLTITQSNAFVTISWPVSAAGFQLQESTNLSLPDSWSSVPQTTTTNGAQISVTIPVMTGSKFFRLRNQ
jgi:hypothetical protein